MQANEPREEADLAKERWEKLMANWPEMFYCRLRGRRRHPMN